MKAVSSRETLFFLGGHFANDMAQTSLPVILAFMYQAGRLESYSQVAMLIMANTVLNALIQPLAGSLADSKPRPYLMSLGILMSVLGVMFVGLAQGIVMLYALVCLNGIGSAIFHPAAGKMTNVFSGLRQGRGMSVFSAGGNLGSAAGPFYFTGCYLILGLDATLMMCVPGFVMVVLYMLKNRYYTAVCRHQAQRQVAKATSSGAARENVGGFVYLVAVLFIRSAGWCSFATFIALYYMHELHVSDEISSLVNGVVCIFGALATFTGGTLSDRLGFNKVIVRASLAAVPFIVLFTLTDNPYLASLLLLPFAFLYFAGMAPLTVVGQKFLCNHVGMATGFTIGLSMSFGGLVGPFVGELGDIYGIKSVMYVVAACIAVSALATVFIPKVEHKRFKLN